MQFNLPDPFAPNISGQFYNYLAHGHAIPEAARQARRAVKRESEIFVGMIALYAAHPDGSGRIVWHGSGSQTYDLFRPADVSDLPSPASGLIGRQRELMNIGTRLLEGTRSGPLTVTLHGAGGIGKTALLWQALQRFAPSFDLTLAIGLDPLPSLESVLGQLEKFLGLRIPCADETKERETIVRNALTSGRALLGLDNFETLNHALNEEASVEGDTAKSLHEFFSRACSEGVALCVTSREPTDLPSEELFEVHGLEEASGGALFREFAGSRRDTLTESQTHEISEAVGGHPLALQLLGSVYKKRADLQPKEFLKEIQSLLSGTRNKWQKTRRHISLEECFAFSLDNLPKTEEGKAFQTGISRLSVFVAFFATSMAAPTLAGKWPADEEEDKRQQGVAQKIVHALWERGLLERLSLPLQDENFYLYRVHPALGQFAAERVLPEDLSAMRETHFHAMRQLARRAYPASEGGGIYSSPFMSAIARVALPDMLKAAQFKQDKESSTLLYHLAFLNTHFGDLDGAMQLYQQALQIDEGLGDLQGKSATLHQMAGIYVTRGDLDGAMQLYQQSLEIKEGLGDLQGKSATLHAMANVFVTRGDLDGAMQLYQQSLEIKEGLGDLKGKSATLHQMAGIYVTRGDLDGAMQLYQQALQIDEGLGDLKGKSATLINMGVVLFQNDRYTESLSAILSGLKILIQLGAKLDIETVMRLLKQFQQAVGTERFTILWKEVTGSAELPDWLSPSDLTPNPSPAGEGSTAEQFIAEAIRSAREKRPEAEAYFKSAQKMASDSSAPKELQALGKVLQRILLGSTNVDLSALPDEWAELVRKTIHE